MGNLAVVHLDSTKCSWDSRCDFDEYGLAVFRHGDLVERATRWRMAKVLPRYLPLVPKYVVTQWR